MKKQNTIKEKIELLIGKGMLFIIEVLIMFGLFWLCLFILNWLIQLMTTHFWFTMLFVCLDIGLIFKELCNLEDKRNIKKK